jgi:tripartite ATP-independent transporter DctP family solute receptor
MAMEYMGQRLKLISKGSMKLDIYPSGQLGSERELIELLQIGSLAMTKVSASPMESFVPEFKVFSIPYTFRDQNHFWQVLESELGKNLIQRGDAVRLRGLTYYDAGSRSFYSADKPIHTPNDLAGLKIRVQNSPTSVAMVNTLGGSATPISWGELYTALQQGVVDGAENNPPSFYLSKHFEVCRYFTLDEHTYVPDILLMSLPIWKKLTSQQQQWLQQAANESSQYQRELWQQSTSDALQQLADDGVEIIYPTKAIFREKVAPLRKTFKGSPVGNLLEEIENIK